MNYSQKGFVSILVLIGIVSIIGVVGYRAMLKNKQVAPTVIQPISDVVTPDTPDTTPPVATVSLAADKKSINLGTRVLLPIDAATIVTWFRTNSQLCDAANIASTPGRTMFCQSSAAFKSETRFASIVTSPDAMNIGFTIESDTLSPDTVVGIFSRSTNTTTILSTYYLGNTFIGFSPNGTNFVHTGGCFEGMCGLYVQDTQTLASKARINDPASTDARERTATFVRWISDTQIEYRLGSELKQISF